MVIEYIGLKGFISSSQQELGECHNSLHIRLGRKTVSCNSTPSSASVLAWFGERPLFG